MTAEARWTLHGEVEALHLSALEEAGGVTAFFTGRMGGTSERWSGGLNWSYSVGDVVERVHENKRRTLAIAGVSLDRAVMAGLVHGNRAVAVTGAEPHGADDVRVADSCDAVVTDVPNLALVVTAADCVPVYLYDSVRRVIGLAHAGWRGTVAGVAGATVREMTARFGTRPADVLAAVGPSIGPCCYEVDELVVGPVRSFFGPDAPALLAAGKAPGKFMLDLWTANRLDLQRAGVEQISQTGACTSCQADRFFSHRAEAGRAGRGAAVLALTGRQASD